MIGYYVTFKDAGRVAWLLGPFENHNDAISLVDEVAAEAEKLDPWAHFYARGTASITSDKPLPAGKLNERLPHLLKLKDDIFA